MPKAAVQPDSYLAAEIEYEDCLKTMQDIQARLGQRNRLGQDGKRLSFTEYEEWRGQAKGKLRITTDRMRLIKKWMKKSNPREKSEKLELKTALEEYGAHLDECVWWDDDCCDCGLDRLFDKYGLGRLNREDVDMESEGASK